MKIVSWNCNCAFRNKYQLLPPADVLIVQESESPEFLQKHSVCLPFLRHLWVGKRAHKGLSIFCSEGTDVKIADFYNEAFEFVVPVEVQRKGRRFILWAVWTQAEGNDCYNGYVVTLTKAMIYYEKYLREDSLIIGDFNSNARWNEHFKREFNHDSLVAFLEKNMEPSKRRRFLCTGMKNSLIILIMFLLMRRHWLNDHCLESVLTKTGAAIATICRCLWKLPIEKMSRQQGNAAGVKRLFGEVMNARAGNDHSVSGSGEMNDIRFVGGADIKIDKLFGR